MKTFIAAKELAKAIAADAKKAVKIVVDDSKAVVKAIKEQHSKKEEVK